MGGAEKLLNRIKSMYDNSLAYIIVKGESECFRIDSGVRQGCIISLALQCIYGCSSVNGDREEGSEVFGEQQRVEFSWPLVCK